VKRRKKPRQNAWVEARKASPCSHRQSDWTWVPERARWEGLCQDCGWTHVASPETAEYLERCVAAYCDSHPLTR